MKRISLLITVLLALSPLFSYAQPGPADFDLGLKLGATFAKLDGETWQNGYKAGFHGGIFGGVKVKKIGVQVEAYFSQQRYTTNGVRFYNSFYQPENVFKNPADSAKEASFSVGYLNIPVLFQLKLFGNAWLQAGPQYSGLISIKDNDDVLKDASDLLKTGDLSGVVGVWLNLPAGLNAGARYIFGLSDLNVNSAGDTWKQRTIQLHIGYNFL